jgi:hypothetical protein
VEQLPGHPMGVGEVGVCVYKGVANDTKKSVGSWEVGNQGGRRRRTKCHVMTYYIGVIGPRGEDRARRLLRQRTHGKGTANGQSRSERRDSPCAFHALQQSAKTKTKTPLCFLLLGLPAYNAVQPSPLWVTPHTPVP